MHNDTDCTEHTDSLSPMLFDDVCLPLTQMRAADRTPGLNVARNRAIPPTRYNELKQVGLLSNKPPSLWPCDVFAFNSGVSRLTET